jgi:hypothetical protein
VKKIYFLFLFLAVMAGGAMYYYLYYFSKPQMGLWDFVPENAVMVYESDHAFDSWGRVQQTNVWENLHQIPFFVQLFERVNGLDTLNGAKGNFELLLKDNLFLFSVHVVAKDDFDFLFYIPLDNAATAKVFKETLAYYINHAGFKHEKRVLDGVTINEVQNRDMGITFSYLKHGNVFIGSFTPFLVEDVVRNIVDGTKVSFKAQHAQLFDVAEPSKEDGNIYINVNQVPLFASLFTGGFYHQRAGLPDFFSHSALLDLKAGDKDLLLNGFIVNQPDDESLFLNTFLGQKPKQSQMRSLIPNRTAYFYHLSFHDPVAWAKKLNRFLEIRYPKHLNQRSAFSLQYGVRFENFYKWIGDEIGLVVPESVDPANPEMALIVHTKDINEAWMQVNKLAEEVVRIKEDTLFLENYQDIQIRQLEIEEFPSVFLGPDFLGFSECFYMPVGDFLVFGNNLPLMKNLLNDIYSENTWGKTMTYNEYLDGLLAEANVSMVVNTARAWKLIQERLNPKWRKFFDSYTATIRSFELAAVQFQYQDNKFYTSVDVKYGQVPMLAAGQSGFDVLQQTKFDFPVISRPFIFRNPVDKSLEVVLQDSLFQVNMIGKEGPVVWTTGVGKPIVGEMAQIKLSSEKNPGFFFSTISSLHVIDRKGQPWWGFPVELPEGLKVETSSVIDYDNSGNYRFLLSDKKGNLYMYSKDRELLDGWNPKELSYRLSSPAFHIRVRNKDCIVAVQENGVINVMNRRGELYKGFPLEFSGRISSPLFLEPGSSFDQTYFTTITNTGELVKFNLEGKVVNREQLIIPSKGSSFQMVLDGVKRNFVIVRREGNRVSLLDRKGNLIFEKDYITSGDMAVQFYSFGAGNEIYAITDKIQEFTYFYNGNGDLINFKPVESGFEIGLLYFEGQGKYHVYKNYDKYFQIATFGK